MNLNNVVKYYGKRALLIVALCLIAAAAFCACVVGVCVDWRGNN